MHSRHLQIMMGILLLLISIFLIIHSRDQHHTDKSVSVENGITVSYRNELRSSSTRSGDRARERYSRPNYMRMIDPIGDAALEMKQIDLTAIDLGDYGNMMVVGNFVEDIRKVEPSGTTDLREFALSLPILESRTDHSYDYLFRRSQAAKTEREWVMPSDGAQRPFRIRRLGLGENGSQRIEVEKWLRAGQLEIRYVHITTLQRGFGGWDVLDVSLFKSEAEQDSPSNGG